MLDIAQRNELHENWRRIVSEVAGLSLQSGRRADAVRVIGVTKYVDAETTAVLIEAGCNHVGESRPQVLWEKAEQIAGDENVTWHLIGHLQRNKVRRLLRHDVPGHQLFIQSIDSQRLLAAVAEEAKSQQKTIPVLLEVNISGDKSKTGLSQEDLRRIVDDLPDGGVNVVGLMSMAGLGTDASSAQQQFAATRELRDELSSRSGLELAELSMGMSADFPQAIAEGATMVRIGSRLFETGTP